MSALNLFPARVPIGKVRLPDKPDGTEGDELNTFASMEFLKALKILFERVGGANGAGSSELTELITQLLMSEGPQPAEAAYVEPVPDYGPQVAALAGMAEEVRAQQDGGALFAEVAALRQQVERLTQLIAAPSTAPAYSDFLQAYAEPRAGTDWEHPGKIGARTASTGAFTTLTTLGGATFHATSTALTNGAAAAAGTLANAPAAGNPTKWIGINDNGTTRYIPAW